MAAQSKVKRAAAGQNRNCMGWLGQRSREMARDIWLVLRVRSFQLIVLQVSVASALQPSLKPSALLGEQDTCLFILGRPVNDQLEAVACISFSDGQALKHDCSATDKSYPCSHWIHEHQEMHLVQG